MVRIGKTSVGEAKGGVLWWAGPARGVSGGTKVEEGQPW